MNFLRKLFTGGGGAAVNAHFFYVRPKRCDEIVQVRINPHNDLSLLDDGNGFFVRKTARGNRCPFEASLYVVFDQNRRPVNVEIENGESVTEADYLAWVESRNTPASS